MAITNFSWQNRQKPTQIKLAPGKLTIPAFDIEVVTNRCRQVLGSHCVPDGKNVPALSGLAELTIEFWVKPQAGIYVAGIYVFQLSTNNFVYIVPDLTIQFTLNNGVGTVNVTSEKQLSVDTWNHVACVWDGATMTIRINDELDSEDGALVGGVTSGNTTTALMLSYNNAGDSSPAFRFNEIRIWNVARSVFDLADYKYSPRDATQTIDTNLVSYWPLQQEDGDIIADAITINDWTMVTTTFGEPDNTQWIEGDSLGYRLGGNWRIAVFDVNTEKQIGLRFPIQLPADANFALCGMFVVSEGVSRRFILSNPIGLIIDEALEYTGQALTNLFKLEIWYQDGAFNAILSEELILYTTSRRIVTEQDYGTINADDEINVNRNIASALPASFPIIFDQEPAII